MWNWALAEWNRQYEAGEKPTALKLKKQFNQIRREQFPWTWEVTKNASDQPFLDLGQAFTAFFEGRAHRPKFKSKKRSKPSFYLANDQFDLGDHRHLGTEARMGEHGGKSPLPGQGHGRTDHQNGRLVVCVLQVELPDAMPMNRNQQQLASTWDLNRLATLSTGEGVENQAFLKTALGKLRRANKRLHRRKLGSKNREKARRQVARLHYRITCLRDDVLHKLTTQACEVTGSLVLKTSTSRVC